jgi:hypothetical protein
MTSGAGLCPRLTPIENVYALRSVPTFFELISVNALKRVRAVFAPGIGHSFDAGVTNAGACGCDGLAAGSGWGGVRVP